MADQKITELTEKTSTADDDLIVIVDSVGGANKKVKIKNSKPYKVYRALLNQSGTADPTATVLENTLGGTLVWTRNGAGDYVGTLAGAFVGNKSHLLTGRVLAATMFGVAALSKFDDDSLSLTTTDVDLTAQTATPADELLASTPIQILIYP